MTSEIHYPFPDLAKTWGDKGVATSTLSMKGRDHFTALSALALNRRHTTKSPCHAFHFSRRSSTHLYSESFSLSSDLVRFLRLFLLEWFSFASGSCSLPLEGSFAFVQPCPAVFFFLMIGPRSSLVDGMETSSLAMATAPPQLRSTMLRTAWFVF